MGNVPQVLREQRKANQNIPIETLVDAYYNSLEKLQASKKDGSARLRYAMMCLVFLEPLITYSKREWGSVPPSIPAIPEAIIFQAINGNKGELENIKDIVGFFPQLGKYQATVEEGFAILDVAAKVREHVRDHPGCLQNGLKKALVSDNGRLISRVVHYMEIAGQIRRKKGGNSYELYIIVTKKELPLRSDRELGSDMPRETRNGHVEQHPKELRWWHRHRT